MDAGTGLTWWLVLFLAVPPPPLRGIEAYAMPSRGECSNTLELVDLTTSTKGEEGVLPEGRLPPRLSLVALSRGEREVMACVDGGTLKALRAGKMPHEIAVFSDTATAPVVKLDTPKPKDMPADTFDRAGGVPRDDINSRR